jgi:hypothetical protein
MRVNKPQGVLYLFETFLLQGSLSKKKALEELEVSDLTFRRYLNELRCYFANFDRNEEILYDKKANLYRFRKF